MSEADVPRTGDVFDYAYLWHREALEGEESGRKLRPVCMAMVVPDAGRTVLFVVPITSHEPTAHRVGVRVPAMEARRAGLTPGMALWVMVDEVNVDVFETSFALEDRRRRGAFSRAFADRVLEAVRDVRRGGRLDLVRRE